LVEDRNNSKKRQFAVMVTVGELFCTGYGPNKKMAKRSAAEGLLKLLNQGPVESKDQQIKKDKTRKVSTSTNNTWIFFCFDDGVISNCLNRR
jgi:dsRNA-specific ribonuclease